MSLRTYTKAVPRTVTYNQVALDNVNIQLTSDRVTLWSLSQGIVNDVQEIVNRSSVAGILIPTFLIGMGFFLIWQQVYPSIDEQLKEAAGYYDQGTTSLVSETFISERSQYLSNPGADNFRQLTEDAFKQGVMQQDPVSNSYSDVFYISIPALGMDRLPVASNVESGVEEAYNSVLKSKLAHFRNTGLPISNIKNNIVIYGHSARDYYEAQASDPETAFSYLSELKVGDEIILEVEGVKYRYIMSRSKIVEPGATEIITGIPGKRTLTLFTCYPRGNNSHRYVAIANPV